MRPGGVKLNGWLPTFPVGRHTRITHYMIHRSTRPDVVFFLGVSGWLGAFGEYRYP
jgi:hypothetical protein